MTEYPGLASLLPHRPPMILLDQVLDDGDETITCAVTLRPDSPFVENGSVAAVVATEYMAQCVAAYAGLQAFRRGDEIRTGYVIGARRIELAVDDFSVGEELIVRAQRIWGDNILGKFECSVDTGEGRAASATLTVFQGDPDTVRFGPTIGS